MPKTLININRFLGLNEQGNTQLKIGEAERMTNWRLVDEYKPRVLEGYAPLFTSIGEVEIRAMWSGEVGGSARYVFVGGGHVYRDFSISGTAYDSLVTSYTNVDVIKTTALSGAEVGTTGIDNVVILKNSAGTQLTEVTQANIDLVASVGKFYFDADEKLNIIVAKNAYANIGVARTDLGTSTGYYRIGALADGYTNFFFFNSKLYIQNGVKYYSWSGTGAITEVAGYAPLIAVATPPAGGGTSLESINLLTGQKRQWFSGDGTSKDFFIAELAVNTIDEVKNLVTGVAYTLTTDYTVNTTLGKVTFVSAHADLENNVEITWTKGSGNRTVIESCKEALLYGGTNDNRIFMWDGTTNTRYHSGLAYGVPSCEYFPAENYYNIGSNEGAITDIVKQYDRQIIYLDNKKAYYSYYNKLLLNDNTYAIDFPVYPLSDAIGNVAFGQAQIIQNNPFTIQNGIHQWTATNVRDEKNATKISDRVDTTIKSFTLENVITFDYEEKSEYWISYLTEILVYNYRLDAWYKFNLQNTPTCFYNYNGVIHFGTDNGKIMYFDEDLRYFGAEGENIVAELALGFTDAGQPNRIKNLEDSYLTLKAETHAEVEIFWETDKEVISSTTIDIGYNNLDYDDINYDDWSYGGNYNPKPFRVKTKARNWTYYRPIFKLNTDYFTAQIIEYTFEPFVNEVIRR